MSEDVVIRVENLGKRYHLGIVRHDTLRDRLAHALRAPVNRLRGIVEPDPTEFWALRDVSFEVKRGEVLGIIGRNGAGKSTLLKVLSRITEPTTGHVAIRGRVASLLEVGTGFHPELSGRENIFLNGAILGMSRAEIRRKFDEIVAFAEVERFLDTPVKHYSSGMYVRLAFAVAAHLEPEILIVDEVLAVGDAAFQKKCLGKIRDVAQHNGRTVLFVSHNLHAVLQLCSSAMLLAEGRIEERGPVAGVLNRYHGADALALASLQPPPELAERAFVTRAQLQNADGQPLRRVRLGDPWSLAVHFRVVREMSAVVIGMGVTAVDGTAVQTGWSPPRRLATGDYTATFTQNAVVLATGSYHLVVGLSENGQTLQHVEVARLEVEGEPMDEFPVTAGAGFVLNSMEIEVACDSAPAR